MRIAKIESLHCNAGWRDFSFLKITTGDGLAGWSEYMENFGAEGLSFVLDRLGERLIGMDPRPVEKITAFPQGAGPGVGLHLDPNFNFKTEGYIRLAQALEPFDLVWLEVDSYDPDALATIGRSARTPIASLESLYGRRQFRPYLEKQAVDVAIIDVAWNGILESFKIAAMAGAYEVNVAPHNFNGHIGSLMSTHLCAAIPNFPVMEIDIEDVPWKDDLATRVPAIENGEFLLPTGIGWGADVNEDAVRAHPPLRPVKWTP